MQRTDCVATVVGALLVTMTGCGTMLNMDGKEKIDWAAASVPTPDGKATVPKYQRPTFAFGGLANDVAWIKDAKETTEVIFSLVDMPFSLVGDIVTLPWIAHDRLNVVRPTPPQDELTQFWMDGDVKNASPAAKEPR